PQLYPHPTSPRPTPGLAPPPAAPNRPHRVVSPHRSGIRVLRLPGHPPRRANPDYPPPLQRRRPPTPRPSPPGLPQRLRKTLLESATPPTPGNPQRRPATPPPAG
ncbi:hypothetical protein APPUASWS_015065, partial [Arthrospira platensis str. Paraca]